jgi:DNA excision repair protein ERCC-2
VDYRALWPYPSWRAGQEEIARRAYLSAREGSLLLLNYPTGAGKTAAVLAGALAAALEEGLKVVYLVRAKAQFQAPLRELKLMSKRVELNAVFLQNKRDFCQVRGASLLPYDDFIKFCAELRSSGLCPFSRAPQPPVFRGVLGYEDIVALAAEAGTCPYEVARSALRSSHVVVAAYNYVFDPSIRPLFLEDLGAQLERVVLIVDEAHNLPYSLSSILSKELSERAVKRARRELARFYSGPDKPRLERDLYALSTLLKRLRAPAKGVEGEFEVSPSDVIEVAPNAAELLRVSAVVERSLGRASELRALAAFLMALSERKPGYVLAARVSDGEVTLVNLCVAPGREAAATFSSVRSACLMSGTLPPREYMVHVLGLDESRVRELRIPTLWASNAIVVALRGVSSRYVERVDATFELMSKVLDELFARLSRGVALVVAPSYSVAKALRARLRSSPIFLEREGTRVSELLNAVRSYDKLMVLCVAWGKLVEGIELRLDGESLVKLIALAGLPVPEPNLLNKHLLSSLRARTGDFDAAWKMVYLIPAAVKAAQAIGRGLRSERDRVAVAILDERALEPTVKNYLEGLGYAVNPAESPEELLAKLPLPT